MRNYRICSDKVFICPKGFEYKGERIDSVAICFEYSFIDKVTGQEMLFTCNDNEDMTEQTVDGHYPNAFYKCCYDSNSKCGYIMIPNEKLIASCDYNVIFRVYDCLKWTSDSNYPMEISYDEFCDILINNPEHWDSTNNKPTQSCSYCCNEVIEKYDPIQEHSMLSNLELLSLRYLKSDEREKLYAQYPEERELDNERFEEIRDYISHRKSEINAPLNKIFRERKVTNEA